MYKIQNWIGRLSFPVLILLHLAGAILGAVLFMFLAAIVAVIFQVKDDSNTTSIAALFLLAGLICPSLLLWRARNRYFRKALPPPLTPEFIRKTPPTMDHNAVNYEAMASTEPALQTTSDQPVGQRSRDHLLDVAEYNRTRRQTNIEGSSDDQMPPQDSYQQSHSSNIHSLLKPSPRRWRWWYTLSTLLSVIVILAIFSPAINIPIRRLDLEVTRTGLLTADEGNAIEILNVGSEQVKITGISINDRSDCTIHGLSLFSEGVEKKPLARELKVGDSFTIWSRCQIIRVTIEAETGSETYSFVRK
jgi:hypothetical protein